VIDEIPFVLESRRGWPIRGEVRHPGNAAGKLVVVSHGFKGFKDWGFFPWTARELAAAGYTVVTFNFSGSGIGGSLLEFTEYEKFRDNSLGLEIEDLLGVLDAAARGVLPGISTETGARPALLGHSRGALVSLAAAERNSNVTRVVTWAGIGPLEKRYDQPMREEWRRRGSLEVLNARTGQVLEIGVEALDDLESRVEDYDPVRIVRRLDIPILSIHGTADATIPIAEARELFAAEKPGRTRQVEIPEAGHTWGAVHPFAGPTPHLKTVLEETLQFLRESDA
jgi:uncharacterized protein